MRRTTKIMLGLLGALLLAAFSAFLYLSSDRTQFQKADYVLEADAMYREYSRDEAAGNQKYLNKVLEVRGEIAEATTDQNGSTVLMFREKGASGGVLCTLNGKVSNVGVGQTVRVKGLCTGFLFDVVLNKCEIIGN